ncbi:DUF2268 domain-containing protein [Raoultibacter phocaeensis]|uniref:DUF2268 domain-containing protein n=1 Tax=Raoultibacter phocaeensis TaxID=2479841 RepID=UPI001119837C|nr:DUF2268 domain-containing protein [Raoultibacter phocaeensis]
MNVQSIRSDDAYRAMALAPESKRDDIYRYELMTPLKKKWDCYHVPVKASRPGGYDVVMASDMLGILAPSSVDESLLEKIALISDDGFWNTCQVAVERSLSRFAERGIELPVWEYRFTVLLANPANPSVMASEGYAGDGGIPGFILVWLDPNDLTLSRMPAALAHEANHNVRFQFIEWSNDITLAEMLVSEGLAENFAESLFGKKNVGPWVTKTSEETLRHAIKPKLREALGVQGMAALSAYLYGDEIAALQGYPTAGLPYCAGYACGYHLVKQFLIETGTDIADATVLPASDILEATKSFWD